MTIYLINTMPKKQETVKFDSMYRKILNTILFEEYSEDLELLHQNNEEIEDEQNISVPI